MDNLFTPGERVRLVFHTEQRPIEARVQGASPVGLLLTEISCDGQPIGPTVNTLDDGPMRTAVPSLVPWAGVSRVELLDRAEATVSPDLTFSVSQAPERPCYDLPAAVRQIRDTVAAEALPDAVARRLAELGYEVAPEKIHSPWEGLAPPPAPAPTDDDRRLFGELFRQRVADLKTEDLFGPEDDGGAKWRG